MRKLWWMTLTAAALAVGVRPVGAQEPHGPSAAPQTRTLAPYGSLMPVPPTMAPAVPSCGAAPAPAVESGGCPSGRCGKGGGSCGDCGGCSSCGSGCGMGNPKIKHFVEWLVYIPLDRGKTKCCRKCDSCPPPAWVFFPCEGGGRCGTCAGPLAAMAPAAPATVVYAKEAGATTPTKVVETAYPPPAAEKPVAPPVGRVSTYKPQAVNAAMPVLEPSQFQKAPPANGCAR